MYFDPAHYCRWGVTTAVDIFFLVIPRRAHHASPLEAGGEVASPNTGEACAKNHRVANGSACLLGDRRPRGVCDRPHGSLIQAQK